MGRRASLRSSTEAITFDAGCLIALDHKDRRVLTLVARAKKLGMRITIPATALAQAIRQAGTDLIPLDGPDATMVGLLLARTATADIVDAHVVVCAQRAGQAVITSDAGDLRRIAPGLQLIVI